MTLASAGKAAADDVLVQPFSRADAERDVRSEMIASIAAVWPMIAGA